MPRTLIVKKKTNFETLAGTMIDARVREEQGAEALERLKAANPHLGRDIAEGTVIIVPDGPGLKLSVGDPLSKAPGDSLRTLLEQAVGDTVQRSRVRLAERSEERTALAKAVNSTNFKRAATAAQLSVEPFQAAAKALADEDRLDQEAEQRLGAMSGAAMAALARLEKLGG